MGKELIIIFSFSSWLRYQRNVPFAWRTSTDLERNKPDNLTKMWQLGLRCKLVLVIKSKTVKVNWKLGQSWFPPEWLYQCWRRPDLTSILVARLRDHWWPIRGKDGDIKDRDSKCQPFKVNGSRIWKGPTVNEPKILPECFRVLPQSCPDQGIGEGVQPLHGSPQVQAGPGSETQDPWGSGIGAKNLRRSCFPGSRSYADELRQEFGLLEAEKVKLTMYIWRGGWKMTCPSSIRHRDSNPRPLKHESSRITTTPGLQLSHDIGLSSSSLTSNNLSPFTSEYVCNAGSA